MKDLQEEVSSLKKANQALAQREAQLEYQNFIQTLIQLKNLMIFIAGQTHNPWKLKHGFMRITQMAN